VARHPKVIRRVILWMQTTGVHDERSASAARERCPPSCMPVVACLCCCTCCCTELTLTCQASSTGLSPTSLSQLVLASSSRRQLRGLSSWVYLLAGLMEVSVNVRRSPCSGAAIVTQLVTQLPVSGPWPSVVLTRRAEDRRPSPGDAGSLAASKVNTTTGIPFIWALSTVSWVPALALT
jgi:hypothetical protein